MISAGLNVSDWAYGKDGELLANPNANSYKNSFWSFIDESVVVLCIWLHEIELDETGIYVHQNLQKVANEARARRNRPGFSAAEKARHTNRANKAGKFHSTTYAAYRDRRPVRVIILGKDVGKKGDAEHAEGRMLDPMPWFVEAFDGFSGDIQLRRGLIPAHIPLTEDELTALALSQEIAIIENDENLSHTERKALIKARVGQGLFRTRLLERWNRKCAVTKSGNLRLLIASHIIPWSQCATIGQRLNPSNGLLLASSVDRLFDAGYITFDDRFQIIISKRLTLLDQVAFGVSPGQRLFPKHDDILPSLAWHRANMFEKHYKSGSV
ncbi:hypothetical protein F2P44_33620 [Massilia sp. CCM 8695]|uniref:HNH nuclease domain-containing protein n=1 Tax=Massilia frigida TaxID=2609281 RepID=A0ABX0NKK7_9BURK|nr:HNH endonuclease [Massilia frigida]NHZ84156.1 hypothetical protein [Massilia frigida]